MRSSRAHLVQVVNSSHLEYFRNAVVGVHRYANETGRLQLDYSWFAHELTGDLAGLVERDGVKGVIATVHDSEMEARFAELPVPVVNISNAVADPRLHVVTQDDFQAGQMAARHLVECGCRHFAFWGVPGKRYSDRRLAGFTSVIPAERIAIGYERHAQANPRATHRDVRDFLAGLPPRTGVFAVLDVFAMMFLRVARELGRAVPDDLAILGAGDDQFMTVLEPIPLSSLRFPSHQVGYRAAALLDELIRHPNRRGRRRDIVLPCEGVIARGSTDALMFSDDAVCRAKRRIRENPGTDVATVVRAAGVSRSGLQARFKQAVGRTLLEEIHRQRIHRAVATLTSTDVTVEAVAEMVGFSNVQRMYAAFKRHLGRTPGEVRAEGR